MYNLARLAKAFDTLIVDHISSVPNLLFNRWTNFNSQANFRLVKDFGNKRKINTSYIYKDEYLNSVASLKTQNNEIPIVINYHDYESIPNSKFKSRCHYNPKENKTILDYIKINGISNTSFQTLAVILKRPSYNAVYTHYRRLVKNDIQDKSLNVERKGRFTPEEDQMITDYVNTHGCSPNTIKDLMQRLGGRKYSSVSHRYKILDIRETTEIKRWTLEDDEKMLQYFLNANNEKDPKRLIVERNLKEFSDLSKILGKLPYSCYSTWNKTLLPILKTHVKGLPFDMNWKWKENVMQYIIREKIESPQDIDYDVLIHDVCPGQTRQSLRGFIVTKIRYSKRKSINDSGELSLYEILAEKKKMISSNPGLEAMQKKNEETYLKRANDVFKCYECLINYK